MPTMLTKKTAIQKRVFQQLTTPRHTNIEKQLKARDDHRPKPELNVDTP